MTYCERLLLRTKGRFLFPDKKYHILNFLKDLLDDPQDTYRSLLRWENRDVGIFKIMEPNDVALLWGRRKNSDNMTYDKMSRALRYYYKGNILSKCGRLCYRFHWNSTSVKKEMNADACKTEGLCKSEPDLNPEDFIITPNIYHE